MINIIEFLEAEVVKRGPTSLTCNARIENYSLMILMFIWYGREKLKLVKETNEQVSGCQHRGMKEEYEEKNIQNLTDRVEC